MDKKQGMKYIGIGFSVVGVPARDLSADEVDKFGEAFLLKSGLYEKAAPIKTKKQKPVENRKEQ